MSEITPRPCPEKGFETCDAFIFRAQSREKALKLREVLVDNGIGTKILPEAISWHFAGTWNHMSELVEAHNGDISFNPSREILESSVALPISLKASDDYAERVVSCLKKVIK